MSDKTILVTGVGGAPMLDLADLLLAAGHRVVVADADRLAPGLLLPGAAAVVSAPAGDPDYREVLLRAVADHRVDGIVSGVEHELPALAALRGDLAARGVRILLPGTAGIQACLDKAVFHRMLTAAGIPTPDTWLPDQLGRVPAGPLVVKPRRGQGAKGVMFCETVEQARVLCELLDAPLVQRRLDGREFTADCLIDRSGQTSVVLRWRLLTKFGLSMVGETFHDRRITDRVLAALAAIGAAGWCCVQGFLTGSGEVVMTEANARPGGGFLLSVAAGADLVGQMVAALYGEPVDHHALRYTAGIRLAKRITTLAAGLAANLPEILSATDGEHR